MIDVKQLLGLAAHFGVQRFRRPYRARAGAVVLAHLPLHGQALHVDHRLVIDVGAVHVVFRQVQILALFVLRHRHHPGGQAFNAALPGDPAHVFAVGHAHAPVPGRVLEDVNIPVVTGQARLERADHAAVRVKQGEGAVFPVDLAGIRAVVRAGQVGGHIAPVCHHQAVHDPGDGHAGRGLAKVHVPHQDGGKVIRHVLGVHIDLHGLCVHRHAFDPEKLIPDDLLVRGLGRQMLNERHLAALDIALNAQGRRHFVPAAAGVLQEIQILPAGQLHQHGSAAAGAGDLPPPVGIAVGRHHDLLRRSVVGHALVVAMARFRHLAAHGIGGCPVPFRVRDRGRICGRGPQRRAGVGAVQIHVNAHIGVFDGLLGHGGAHDGPGHQVCPFALRVDGVREIDLACAAGHGLSLALDGRQDGHAVVVESVDVVQGKHAHGPVAVPGDHRLRVGIGAGRVRGVCHRQHRPGNRHRGAVLAVRQARGPGGLEHERDAVAAVSALCGRNVIGLCARAGVLAVHRQRGRAGVGRSQGDAQLGAVNGDARGDAADREGF